MTDTTNTNWSASAAGKALSLRNKIVASVFALLCIVICGSISLVSYIQKNKKSTKQRRATLIYLFVAKEVILLISCSLLFG